MSDHLFFFQENIEIVIFMKFLHFLKILTTNSKILLSAMSQTKDICGLNSAPDNQLATFGVDR